ncbi:metallophosphoesterase [Algibacter sp. L4_22]|uniref:metallophosphoesterase n=1 Tax=Algibacter sp. L4_22 TaxID=2942477 RepID=UPI00201B8C1B|nr:metallophosphoesterase [Algibacter sp. L4_22]MCL5129271.1 metallophosphoesterase [Algibacter sp. L4_22]
MIKKNVLFIMMLFTAYSFLQAQTQKNIGNQIIKEEESVSSIVVQRGPYLQSGTSSSVIIKWRTNVATESFVHYGTSLKALSMSVTNTNLTTEHVVKLKELNSSTKYYFNIGNKMEILTESLLGDMYVITAPELGTDQFVRAWILGDPGTANTSQKKVRDAYYNYVAKDSANTDMMLFLGDNAYSTGKDEEYQEAFFDVYNEMFMKSVAWSCIGNHDGYSADSDSQSGPYYDIFTFPTEGEAGGVASGTEAYYAFDYANIHFIVLDSHHSNREIEAPMYNWALADMQNTTQDWVVALFHHPAYSKGSHDSDSEDRLIDMRENFMPMLEANGVDLILNGHSHSYERSYFLNGHHGLSNTFNTAEITNGGHTVGVTGHGDGKANGNGVYQKAKETTEGAVYITTGSAGQISGGDLNHQAMHVSLNSLGSCVMEIENDGKGGQNLNVKFVRETGEIDDYFSINKTGIVLDVDKVNPLSKLVERDSKSHLIAVNEMLHIEVAAERLKKVKFFNEVGKLIKKSKKEVINVSGLASGFYVVEIKTSKATYFKTLKIE